MNRFAATTLNERNKRKEALYRLLFGFMTLLLIVPVVLIVATLIVRGGPALSFDFFFSSPTNGMTEGGIFPALIGTLWIVLGALVASVPHAGVELLFKKFPPSAK